MENIGLVEAEAFDGGEEAATQYGHMASDRPLDCLEAGAEPEEGLTKGEGYVMVKFLVRWLAVVLWMGVIFALSAIPSLASPFEPVYDFILRKLAHLAIYTVLTVLLVRAFRLHVARPTHAWLLAMLVAALYACSDEWHQTFVPGREGTVRDILIDSMGIVGVWVLASRTCIKDMLAQWLAKEA